MQFEADPGVYDIKFQDLIEPAETVQATQPPALPPSTHPSPLVLDARSPSRQVSSSPVSTATSISALGDLATVGSKFAASRSGKLISSTERDVDGSLVYQFEVQGVPPRIAFGPRPGHFAALPPSRPPSAAARPCNSARW